jgi:hypothetical protein
VAAFFNTPLVFLNVDRASVQVDACLPAANTLYIIGYIAQDANS